MAKKLLTNTEQRLISKQNIINAWRNTNRYNISDLQRIWGVSQSTAYRYLRNPELLTIEQTRHMRLDAETRAALTA